MASGVRRFLRRPEVITAVIAVLALAGTFVLRPGSVHPNLSKQAVIASALKGYDSRVFTRVEAKLMHRRSLQLADSMDRSSGNPDELIWAVAVSGNYGVSPSFGCCGVPADYHGYNTWGMAIIVDAPGIPQPNEFEADWHGDWPPFFDSLPDLAAGT